VTKSKTHTVATADEIEHRVQIVLWGRNKRFHRMVILVRLAYMVFE